MQFIINPYVYDVKNVYISIHKHFEQVKNLTIYFHSYLLNLWKERQRYKKIELCYCINTYVCYRVLKILVKFKYLVIYFSFTEH